MAESAEVVLEELLGQLLGISYKGSLVSLNLERKISLVTFENEGK